VSLRSPLGSALGLGSAKSGSGHWYAQRVSAVAVALLGVWLLASLLTLGSVAHAAIVGWLVAPTNAALCALFVVASAYHAWLGLQVIIEDYVGHKGGRLVAIIATKFVFIIATAAGVLAVLRIAVGGGT
jgi:succinate dehydrogenase / fumarate reductase membrane anchor subunit